jgi:hypothetical protein
MPVRVAEYLGIRPESGFPIHPHPVSKTRVGEKPELPCPFRNAHCSKASAGNKPICSVRDAATDELWITCEHRLCATQPKESTLTEHQKNILLQVARTVFEPSIPSSDIIFKREVAVPVTEDNDYKADFVLWRLNPRQTSSFNPDRAMILEMQGGGETTNTGVLTQHVDAWEQRGIVDNDLLAKTVPSVSTLETNAWRRQQEQFLVKGNVAMMTGGRMVFCVGTKIYDYLMSRFREGILSDLRYANWSLALITFEEDKTATPPPNTPINAVQLRIDPRRTLFTNYNTFVQVLTNQASPCSDIFTGSFRDLNSNPHSI